jgi:hypothetical protein
MKSTIKKESNPQTPFPKLMIASDGLVVLLGTKGKGQVVNSGIGPWPVGELASWDSRGFEDFHGTITLSNY